MMIGYPFDGILCFFKAEQRFRKKNKEWLKKYGPINRGLNKFRKFLLCRVPYKLWSTAPNDYDPIVKVNCPEDESYDCPPDTTQYDSPGPSSAKESDFTEDGDVSEMQYAADEAGGDICGSPEEYGENAPREEPSGLGMSPECLQAAARVVRAVEDDLYSPANPNANDPTLQTDIGTVLNENFVV